VTVPTEVKTCYVVQVQIPLTLEAEASVKMVDREKVDMRFSSKTDCAAGPVTTDGPTKGLWKTDLEFKTYVQHIPSFWPDTLPLDYQTITELIL
jgi:hypothetical protein